MLVVDMPLDAGPARRRGGNGLVVGRHPWWVQAPIDALGHLMC
jgi:hypothetical protein